MLPTSEQIEALAPDPASFKAGQGLANPRHWVTLGYNEAAAWGECRGSGKDPYRAQVDLHDLATRCSCPSRKFPCKHALGLLLVLASQPDTPATPEPPTWVREWLAGRAAKRTQAEAPAAPPAAPSASPRSKRNREQRVAEGLDELQRWLTDRVRSGLASQQADLPAACQRMAARMVDAQAPGVARLLRLAASAATSGSGWQNRLLEQFARLYLLTRAYPALGNLPVAAQADLRAALGFTLRQEDVLVETGLLDQWLVLGRQEEEEEQLRVQRTWLWGLTSQQPALVLAFSAGNQPLDRSLIPGQMMTAELVFFPSAAPLRVLVRERQPGLPYAGTLPTASLDTALGKYAAVLAANPWLERYPLLIGPCRLAGSAPHWYVTDEDGHGLPLTPGTAPPWQVLAVSGGAPGTLCGIWDGVSLAPLGMQVGNAYVGF
ncbi:MAG: SWIM zinc finger family protein [Oscillochloridaceae bacterium umkhey_bin13]